MKLVKIFSILAFILMLFVYINYFSSFVMPWQKEETIKTALLWGGLHELPENAEIVSIRKYGSLLTRQFKIEFISTKPEIERWISNSKRLKNNKPKKENKIKIFSIYPGESDSNGGEVRVNGNKVLINISWS